MIIAEKGGGMPMDIFTPGNGIQIISPLVKKEENNHDFGFGYFADRVGQMARAINI